MYMRSPIVAALVFTSVFGANVLASKASETKEITRTVTIYGLDDAPKFAEQIKAVCADKSLHLSEKARNACDTGNFPKLTKQMRFRNAGFGAELNALAAQR